VPTIKNDPPAFGLCMLWQPPHSATPPEWKAYAIPLKPMVNKAAAMITNPNFNPFISSSYFF
jgi:hypothetical protein